MSNISRNPLVALAVACIEADDGTDNLSDWAESVRIAWDEIKDHIEVAGPYLLTVLPREFPVYHQDSAPSQLARVIVDMIKADGNVPGTLKEVPEFFLTGCRVEPSVSLDTELPDEIRISVEVRGILRDQRR